MMLAGVDELLAALPEKPQAALLDLWGLVHDGNQLYPQAVAGLQALHDAGIPVVFVSNSSLPSSSARELLDKLAIPRELYVDVVTAGEAALKHFAEDTAEKNYYYIGRETHVLPKSLTHMHRVDDPAKADMVVVTTFTEERPTIEAMMPVLEACGKLHLPMVCMNPDEITVTAEGKVRNQGGQIGVAYQRVEGAGTVKFFGKPFPEVYKMGMAIAGVSDPSRVMVMGDSPSHDIVGGNAQGFTTVLATRTGILNAALGENPTREAIDALCAEHIARAPGYGLPSPSAAAADPVPDYVIPALAPGRATGLNVSYDKASSKYDIGRPDYLDAQVRGALVDKLGLKPDSVVVEIGAGSGKLSRKAVPHVGKLICVEHGEGMRERFRQNLPLMGEDAKKVELLAASAYDTGLPAHSVDAIIMGDAAHHLDKVKALKEFKRILKPGREANMAVFVRYPDAAAPVMQQMHDGLMAHDADGYAKPEANKLGDFGGTLALKQGDHLIAPEGRQVSTFVVPEVVTKEQLHHYLESRSSTAVWAQGTTPDNPVLEPIFGDKDTVEFPRVNHVMTGALRTLERAEDVAARRSDVKAARGA